MWQSNNNISYVSFLLVSEDEIDPLVQMRIDIVRLESLSVFPNEVVGVLRPLRQHDVVDPRLLVALQVTEIEVVGVDQELGEVEELGNQLFDVVDIVVQVLPGLRDRMKLSICDVKPAALQLDVQRGERLHPDHVVQDHGRVWVVSSVVKLSNGAARVLELFVLGLDLGDVLWVLNADRLWKVSKGFGIVQVELKIK